MKIDLCKTKNSYEKRCLNLVNADAGSQNPEHPSRRAKLQMQGGQKFRVYALIESGKIRYVGLTSQKPIKRLGQHLQDMNRENRKEHKTNWLRSCRREGLAVGIKLLRTGLSLEAAQRIEIQIIKRLRPQLVNVHDGGSSGYGGLPEEARKRHSDSGKARYRDPKQKEKAKVISQIMHAAKARKRMEAPHEPEYRRVPEGELLEILDLRSSDGRMRRWIIRQGPRANNIIVESQGKRVICGWDHLMKSLRKKMAIPRRIFTD